MKLNLPIELGQELRKKLIQNFRSIDFHLKEITSLIYKHKTTDLHQHNAKQIDYKKTDVDKYLSYQNKRIEGLVLGHNGNGIQELRDSRTSMDAENHKLLSERLYHDFASIEKEIEDNYEELNTKIERIVNVNDYGADPTGVEDSTKAFRDAFANGGVNVHMTAGTYKIRGIKMPSNSILSGEGINITKLVLNDDAPAETIGVTNRDLDGTAEYIYMKDFSIDGNRDRQDGTLKAAGGSRSSNIRFAGVTNGGAYNIKSYNTLLHGFDITYANDDYFYQGDGVRVNEQLESKYIHIDKCEATGFGDDGITTHHSRYLLITNNYCHRPARNGGNNNGIEIDDGSQHVVVDNNKSEESYGGVEVKAHDNASAPNNVIVSNHKSIKDTRSYNIRHIGHHRAGDPVSKTAHSIIIANCTSITPYANEVFPGTTPRALIISGYKNVQVNGFNAVGDGTFTAGQPVVVVQFMSNNVMLNNINITGFKNAMADVKIFGGANRGKKITVSNVNIWNSSQNIGIAGGGGLYDLRFININLQGRGTGIGLEHYNNTAEIIGVNAENYTTAARITNRNYRVMPTSVKGGFSGGTTGSGATAERSAAFASTGGSFAHSDRSWIAGVGAGSQAHGSRSAVINSLQCETLPGSYCQTIINSRGVKSRGNYSFLLGYGQDGAKYENTTIDMSSTSGNIKTKGTVSSGQNFGDYGEYFESQSGQSIPNGTIVTLDGRFIRKAQSNDVPLGVISGTAGVILGDQMFHHKDKYLKDEFGVTQTELTLKEWQDDEGNWYSEEVEMPIPNPDFVEHDEDYKPRSERPEWNVVGLVGQVFTRFKGNVKANDYIKAESGIGVRDNVDGYYRVLEVTTPYDSDKGYGVAVVLVK